MSSPVSDFWIYNTMLIENEYGGTGTGFLVFRPAKEGSEEGKVFLVTNKHVLNPDPELRNNAKKIILHLNIKNEDQSITAQEAEFPLDFVDGSKSYREHPSEDVDVMVLNITQLLAQYPIIEKQIATYQMLVTPQGIKDWDLKIGDPILTIGYPSGIKHRITNFPFVRDGIIATRIGEELEDEYKQPNRKPRKRILRGFLIDGAVIPGSSGSPVVLKPLAYRYVKGQIQMSTAPLLLLGIISESRYASTPDFMSFAGLGLAFDAQTIVETIELFFQ